MGRSSTYCWIALGIFGLSVGCSAPAATECTDGLDNDGDGLLDEADPDCAEGTEYGPLTDFDLDGIADLHEGFATEVDTDLDGIPDYKDIDSDNDGIEDRIEAGDFDVNTSPVDSDGDGIPDYRDLDSDNNGLSDSIIGTEGLGDIDFDGIPNFADLDDDGDGIFDVVEIGTGAFPINTDGDLSPDFQDIDSDGDLIMDLHEGVEDLDMDGVPNYRDLDSDDDCIPDFFEAGDTDLSTPPIDTDGNSLPNFVDIDSDGDFLLDELEDPNCNGVVDPGESSPLLVDTDGDGVSDVLEYAADTAPDDPTDNPQANGDFVFEIPFMEPTNPPVDTLEFTTSVKFVDLYFSFDTTGSMSQELAAMRSVTTGVPAIIDTLTCHPTGGTCVFDTDCADGICFNGECIEDPEVGDGCLPNIWTGVGRFDEIDTFNNIQAPQPDATVTANAIPSTGGGASEAPLQAPACVADGANCLGNTNCVSGADTCVGFRDDAVRILLQITDADDQCFGARCSMFPASYTGAELISKEIKFIGLYGTDDDSGNASTPQSVAEAIAIAANSISFWGLPFVYPAVDAAVVDQTVNAVRELVNGIDLDVTIEAEDLPNDDGDALQFIDYLEVNTTGVGNCTAVALTVDADGDGFHDAFPSLEAGVPVCWDVHPVPSNVTVNPTGEPSLFRARLTVRGDSSILDQRSIIFFVPPNFVVD